MNQIVDVGNTISLLLVDFPPLKPPNKKQGTDKLGKNLNIFCYIVLAILETCKEQLVKADCTEIRSKWPSSDCALQHTKHEWAS